MFSQDPVNTIIGLTSDFSPAAIRLTATLKLPDLIVSGHNTLDELATRTQCDQQALGRALRFLCQLGLFNETSTGTYQVTEIGQVLSSSHASGLRGWLDHNGSGRLVDARYKPANELLMDAVQTGRPVYEKANGQPFWQDLEDNPEVALAFNSGLAQLMNHLVPEISRTFDWDSVNHLVDVGGGTGALLTRVLSDYPALRGTLVDSKSAIVQAHEVLAPVADRCTLVDRSFFDPLPRDGDAYLIANTLHNWNDEDATKLLRRCAEAAGDGGRLIVVERLVDRDKDSVMQSHADLLMLVLFGGRERTEQDLRMLGSEAALTLLSTRALEVPGFWLLEFAVK